jgi:hypothetical protein
MSEKDQAQTLNEFEEFFLDECVTHEFTLPNGKPMLYKGKPVIGTVCSPGTEKYVKAKQQLDREATKLAIQSLGKNTAANKNEQSDPDADAKFLAEITTLQNFPYPGGDFAVFKNPKLRYMGDEVRALLGNLGNFYGNGKTA